MDNIYIIRTIELLNKTEEDIKKEFEIYKIEHPKGKIKNYDEFFEFQKSWGQDKYVMNCEDNSYCTNFETAKNKVINNICDINDGGVYNYCAILKVPVNCIYATTYIKENDIILFKFDREINKYYQISKDFDKEANYIFKRM